MADNMESLLLGGMGDDSSSEDESDNEVGVETGPLVPAAETIAVASPRPSSTAPSVGVGSGGDHGAPIDQATLEHQEKQRKEKFLMFARVLMKYLEQNDVKMHLRAKAVIRDCAERNKCGDPHYASLTSIMQTKLRAAVGEVYWRKAEDYLHNFLKQRKNEAKAKERPSTLPGSSATHAPSPTQPLLQQQQQKTLEGGEIIERETIEKETIEKETI